MAGYYETRTEHAFKTFAKDLKEGAESPVIYMYGAEEYLIEWAVKTLAGKYINPGAMAMDFERPDGDSVTADEIINACETFSMFSPRRIVWVRDYPALWQDNAKGFGAGDLKKIEEYLDAPNDSTILIFSTSKVKNDPKDRREKKTKLNSLLLKKARCYDFKPLDRQALRAFIEKRIRTAGLTIDRNTVDYLMDVTGYFHKETDYRIMNLNADLDKIAGLSESRVTREDIDRTILGDMDTYIFDFLDHVSSNRKEDAFLLLHNILSSGNDVYSILALLIGQFELMEEVTELRDAAMDIPAIVREMGMHEFRVKKALQAASKFDLAKLRSILVSLYETDAEIKQGNIDGVVALELLIGRI